jgi:hypothetical protein
MTTRITRAHLEAIVARINRVTGSPAEPYSTETDRRAVANIGNYHLSGAYGGWCLLRMVNESGGASSPLTSGHVPARELANLMHAYLAGLAAREQ